jgi:hypothetical protein
MNIRRSQERDKKTIPPGSLKAKDPDTRSATRVFHLPDGHDDKHAKNYDKEGGSWFSPGHPAEIHVFLLLSRKMQRDKFRYEILSNRGKNLYVTNPAESSGISSITKFFPNSGKNFYFTKHVQGQIP